MELLALTWSYLQLNSSSPRLLAHPGSPWASDSAIRPGNPMSWASAVPSERRWQHPQIRVSVDQGQKGKGVKEREQKMGVGQRKGVQRKEGERRGNRGRGQERGRKE